MSEIKINKNELRELLVEYTSTRHNITSNLLGDLKQTQQELKEVSIEHGMKIDSLLDSMKEIRENTAKTNGRVTSIEKWRYTIAGGAFVLATLSIPNISALARLITGQ